MKYDVKYRCLKRYSGILTDPDLVIEYKVKQENRIFWESQGKITLLSVWSGKYEKQVADLNNELETTYNGDVDALIIQKIKEQLVDAELKIEKTNHNEDIVGQFVRHRYRKVTIDTEE